MISKGNTHNDGVKLAQYMTENKKGERAELWELRGFEATTIKEAFRDVEIMAGATKCEQPFFHLQVRNREGERLTRQQWEYAADRIERMLGLTGQPRAISFHTYEHNDDQHMHVAWSRINEETLEVAPLPFYKLRLKKISRELEWHFGLEPVTNHREDGITFAPTRAEQEQARRLGQDIHAVRRMIRECWDRSDCGASFQGALEYEGMMLVQGERRDYIVIDQDGGMHALGKRILDVSAAGIRQRMSDLSREDLPTVEAARVHVLEQGIEKLKGQEEEKSAQPWDREKADREWQSAVIDAAIEQEKVDEKFVEPIAEKARKDAAKEKDQAQKIERPLDEVAAAIRLAYSLSASPQSFARNLAEAGFRLARATKDEAEQSHRNAAFAKAAGRFMPEYREGEFVAIHDRGHVYSLNQKNTGESREEVAGFMRTFDATGTLNIQTTQQQIGTQKSRKDIPEFWKEPQGKRSAFREAGEKTAQRLTAPGRLKGYAADIWNAYQRSDNLRGFVSALSDHEIELAVVTYDDTVNSSIDHKYRTDRAQMLPLKLREGDFVAITPDGRVHNLNLRTTGEAAGRIQKVMGTLDRTTFEPVYAVLKNIEARGALQDVERQAFRDLSAGHMKREKEGSPTGPLGKPQHAEVRHKVKSGGAVGDVATEVVGKGFEIATEAFSSLLSPTLSPQQIQDAGKAKARREVEGEQTIDFTRFTAELAQARQEEERERQRQRERGGRDR